MCYYAIDVTALMGPLFDYTQAIPPGFERPVQGRLLMDEGYFLGRQASKQLDCVQQFLHSGVPVRKFRLGGSGFAILHTKSIVIDDIIFVSGSLNLTNNGETNNTEEMIATFGPSVVRQRKATFERHWNDERATPVDMDMIRRLYKQPPAFRRGPSRSLSRSSSSAAAPAYASQSERRVN